MKEHPIIFSTELIPKILDGTKTQTRRTHGLDDVNMAGLDGAAQPTNPNQYKFIGMNDNTADFVRAAINLPSLNIGVVYHCKCPYGQVGDRLWVRETFMFKKGADIRELDVGTPHEAFLGPPPHYLYKADNTEEVRDYERYYKWRSPLFMPRKASRITLGITKIRVERLQEISEEDAKAEGVNECFLWAGNTYYYDGRTYRRAFRQLWDSLNAKYPWESNPWVWVIEFRKL